MMNHENENAVIMSSGGGKRRRVRRTAIKSASSPGDHEAEDRHRHQHSPYQNTTTTTSRRAFGRVIQDSLPPLRRSGGVNSSGVLLSLKQQTHDHQNDNNSKKLAPAAARLIPPSPSGDLNNSFTEKISNLGIDCLDDHEITPPPPPIVSPPPAKPATTTACTITAAVVVPAAGTSSSSRGTSLPNAPVSAAPAAPLRRPPLRERALDKDNEADKKKRRPIDAPESLYANEILNYWHHLDLEHKVDPGYMDKQVDVSFKMRSILVDWMIEVVSEYSLGNPTLHRAVLYLDRYLSCRLVTRGYLQLLGVAAIFIASKIEEIQPPDTSDLVYITDNTYEKRELIQMEKQILSTLNFDLLTPTAFEFTDFFSASLHLSVTTRQAADYLIELTLLHAERFLRFNASEIAPAACYVAIRCCGEKLSSLNYRRHHRKNNKKTADANSVTGVLSQISRLNLRPEFVAVVEEVVALIFLTLLSGGTVFESSSGSQQKESSSSQQQYITESSSGSSSDVSNSNNCSSLATKYKQFQTERFLAAAASSAACMPTMPWDDK